MEELGLDIAPFRSYNATIGRWLQVDPLTELVPSMTPYRFGFNNPVLYSDPLGLIEEQSRSAKKRKHSIRRVNRKANRAKKRADRRSKRINRRRMRHKERQFERINLETVEDPVEAILGLIFENGDILKLIKKHEIDMHDLFDPEYGEAWGMGGGSQLMSRHVKFHGRSYLLQALNQPSRGLSLNHTTPEGEKIKLESSKDLTVRKVSFGNLRKIFPSVGMYSGTIYSNGRYTYPDAYGVYFSNGNDRLLSISSFNEKDIRFLHYVFKDHRQVAERKRRTHANN